MKYVKVFIYPEFIYPPELELHQNRQIDCYKYPEIKFDFDEFELALVKGDFETETNVLTCSNDFLTLLLTLHAERKIRIISVNFWLGRETIRIDENGTLIDVDNYPNFLEWDNAPTLLYRRYLFVATNEH